MEEINADSELTGGRYALCFCSIVLDHMTQKEKKKYKRIYINKKRVYDILYRGKKKGDVCPFLKGVKGKGFYCTQYKSKPEVCIRIDKAGSGVIKNENKIKRRRS